MTDNADLRAAAEKIAKGVTQYDPSLSEPRRAMVDFIALASPDRILGILSELERKTAALKGIAELLAPDGPVQSIKAWHEARAALEGKPSE